MRLETTNIDLTDYKMDLYEVGSYKRLIIYKSGPDKLYFGFTVKNLFVYGDYDLASSVREFVSTSQSHLDNVIFFSLMKNKLKTKLDYQDTLSYLLEIDTHIKDSPKHMSLFTLSYFIQTIIDHYVFSYS